MAGTPAETGVVRVASRVLPAAAAAFRRRAAWWAWAVAFRLLAQDTMAAQLSSVPLGEVREQVDPLDAELFAQHVDVVAGAMGVTSDKGSHPPIVASVPPPGQSH